MITRTAAQKVAALARQFKAVAIIGPRQSGKTTLARACFPEKAYVSLENPDQRNFALEDPKGFLASYPEGAILDEIQRVPELLSWLQQRLDEETRKGTFILTGSNNFLLLEQITQSLAGRVAYLDLLPLSLEELQAATAPEDVNDLLWKGGYPPIQAEGISPLDWFPAYLRTYVERDVRQIKNLGNLLAFERLIALCAARTGQLVNYSNLSNELGIDLKTVKSWLGILQASYIIHFLPPYFKNFNKRLIKTPKLYFYDTGLAAYLLRIQSPKALANHPMRGALFENFIISELLKNRFNRGQRSNLYFWRDQSGNEIDVLLDEGQQVIPIEIKSGQTIQSAYFKGLKHWRKISGSTAPGLVYYGGAQSQDRSDGMQVRPWRAVGEG
jgi:predicted AAA+ superfamily ATPase